MRSELLKMIEYDDFLYYAFIRDGIKGLIEKLQARLSNEPELKKEMEILQYIKNHKYSLSN